MLYTTRERNKAILAIGGGNIEILNASFYEALEAFQWINIHKQGNGTNKAELTYSGKDLFKKLLKSL